MSLITIQTADAEITVRSRQPQLATLESFEVPQASTGLRYTKVLADGTRVTAGDSRTDHVAVIDNTTGLMWSVESAGDKEDADTGISQDRCKTRCSELRLLGFSDWRLPTRTELAGLVDDCQHEPAIDTDAFPRVKPRWHWTNTAAAWSPASAWRVNIGNGHVLNDHRSLSGFALAVRRAGQ